MHTYGTIYDMFLHVVLTNTVNISIYIHYVQCILSYLFIYIHTLLVLICRLVPSLPTDVGCDSHRFRTHRRNRLGYPSHSQWYEGYLLLLFILPNNNSAAYWIAYLGILSRLLQTYWSDHSCSSLLSSARIRYFGIRSGQLWWSYMYAYSIAENIFYVHKCFSYFFRFLLQTLSVSTRSPLRLCYLWASRYASTTPFSCSPDSEVGVHTYAHVRMHIHRYIDKM